MNRIPEHLDVGAIRPLIEPDVVRAIKTGLADPDVNLVTFQLPPSTAEQVLFDDLAAAIQASFSANIKPPYERAELRSQLRELFERNNPGGQNGIDRLLDRFLFLHMLFSEVAESAEDVLCYGMLGGNGHVLDFPWHVDRVVLSLVDTVVGAGTRWTPEFNVHRERLTSGYIPDIHGPPVVVDNRDARELPAGTVAIFKGELRREHDYPDVQRGIRHRAGREFNRNKGLVHASPLLGPSDRRLFFSTMTFLAPGYLSRHL